MNEIENDMNNYTCSDGVRIQITDQAEALTGRKAFTDYLDVLSEEQDYLDNGVLMGWQDYYVIAPLRNKLGRDQITATVRRTRWEWQHLVDDVLYGDA
tara:strand:+ start:1747 stop:2040 length:294 start_codon:yes stop_codon:yes gene_type:complete